MSVILDARTHQSSYLIRLEAHVIERADKGIGTKSVLDFDVCLEKKLL